MKQTSEAFKEANFATEGREPRFYCRIYYDDSINGVESIYLTSQSDINIIDPAGTVLSGTIKDVSGVSQDITPEDGFSQLGSMSISFLDIGFTSKLNEIFQDNETISNSKVELFYGFKDIDIADYLSLAPMYVESVNNDELNYTLQLKDVQIFTKKTLFGNLLKTEVVNSIGQQSNIALEVVSTQGFEAVEHDNDWDNSPNKTVGYLKVKGATQSGIDAEEVLVWEGKTATEFNIIERGAFGTSVIDILGSQDSNSLEVLEFTHLNLPVPKMIIALLTNDLLDQPGQKIPSHWGAEIDPLLVDTNSIINIGSDLSEFYLDFRDIETVDAKRFIADEILKFNNLAMVINQAGELFLKRFTGQPQSTAGDNVLDYRHLKAAPVINRDNSNIKNVFAINWEQRISDKTFARSAIYIDLDSQQRNNIKSNAYVINLRGVRNNGIQAQVSIDKLASGIRARKSDPAVNLNISTHLRDLIEFDLMDTLTLDLENQPDFATNDPDLKALVSAEIQGITWDFLNETASARLFSTSGTAGQIDFTQSGATVTTFDRTSWTEITSVLTGAPSGGYYVIDTGQTLPDGQYYFLGNLKLDPGSILFGGASVFIDAEDFEMSGATYNANGSGVVGTQGIFGGGDCSQEGMKIRDHTFGQDSFKRKARSGARVPASTIDKIIYNVKVSGSDQLLGFPDLLYGNGSAKGDDTDDQGSSITGGAAVSGGGGLCLICNNFFFNNTTNILLNGDDGIIGNSDPIGVAPFRKYAGSSGFGWGGIFLTYIKDRAAPLPIIGDLNFESRTGDFPGDDVVSDKQPFYSGKYARMDENKNYVPRYTSALPNIYQNTNYADKAFYVGRLVKQDEQQAQAGVDPVENAKPAILNLLEQVNTPLTPLGNQSTITMTATPDPGDNSFSYAKFQYRVVGQDQWVDIRYGITTESSVTVTSDGSTYEFSSQSVNTNGVVSDIRVIESIPVAIVNNNTSESDGGDVSQDPDLIPEVLRLPKITRLRLINSIDLDEKWNQYKSGNAEFDWAKTSITDGGDLVNPSGSLDLHFSGYKVVIKDDLGEIKREEILLDSQYTYTREKNREDGTGRNFSIGVVNTASTAFVTEETRVSVLNPPPDAPTGIKLTVGISSITVSYNLPDDFDFVGVDAYIVEGSNDPYLETPIRLTGNNFLFDELKNGTLYSIGLTSVDEFGAGLSAPIVEISTSKVQAADVDDLSNWATNLDPVDEAFIAANMDNDAVPSVKIVSLAVPKITAGILNASEYIQVYDSLAMSGVRMDGSGVIETINSGYSARMGAVDVPAESANPLIFSAFDGANYPFWIDTNGEFKFGLGGDSLSFSGGVIEFGANVTIGSNTAQLIYVGAGEQFLNINDAIEYLSKTVPAYVYAGFTAQITLRAGFSISEQISIKGLNLGWISIVSEAEVLVDASGFIAATGAASVYPVFHGYSNAIMPELNINAKISVQKTGSVFLFLRSATGTCYNTIDGFYDGVRLDELAVLNLSATIKNIDQFALIGDRGVRILGQTLVISDSEYGIDLSHGSEISITTLTVSNIVNSHLSITNGSKIACETATLNGTLASLASIAFCSNGSSMNFITFNCYDFGSGVLVQYDSGFSMIIGSISRGAVSGAGEHLEVYYSSKATVKNINFANGPAAGRGDIKCIGSSNIDCDSISNADILVLKGGTVNASNAVTNVTLSETPNTLTANGIIYG